MKYFGKKVLAAVMVFSLLAGVVSMSVHSEAKDTYWLQGISTMADGQMKMYYQGSKVVLKGKLRKADSKKAVYHAKEKKSSYTLPVVGNCKVTLIEADNNQTVTYKKWVKERGYKKGAEVAFIESVCKVSGGKITRIYFSA